MLSEYFAHGQDTAQWNFRRHETPQAWKILLLAMYDNTHLRLSREEYKPADFVNALVVAAHWRMDDDNVLKSIRIMMYRSFRDLRHWPEIPLNPLTHSLHEGLFAEVFDAFQVYKFLPQRVQVFPVLSFGVFLWRHCDREFLLREKMPFMDGDLRELVEETMHWESSGRPFPGQFTAMFL